MRSRRHWCSRKVCPLSGRRQLELITYMLPPVIIDHLSHRRQAITKTWLRELWTSPDQTTAEDTPTSELLDHLPDMFEDLLEFLRHGGNPQAEAHARTHGQSRWQQRFRLQEVLRELLLIRSILISEIDQFVGTNFERGADQISRDARRPGTTYLVASEERFS